MDRKALIFCMCMCVACCIQSIHCCEVPNAWPTGVPAHTDPASYTMQVTSGDVLFIPDRDSIFHSDGKLHDFYFWFSATYPSCSVKIAAIHQDPPGYYTIRAVSEIYNKGQFGWNHIDFTSEIDGRFMDIKQGDTIGMIFYYYNYLLYSQQLVGEGLCTINGTMESFSTNFYSLSVNDNFTHMVASNHCRSYMYQTNYTTNDSCQNSGDLSEQERCEVTGTLQSDSADTRHWYKKAAPSTTGDTMVVKAVFTTACVSESGVVTVSDGNGKTLKEIRDSANTSILEDIYSITDAMNITFSSTDKTMETNFIVIQLCSFPKSEVPSGYYCSLPGGGLCRGDIIITVVVIILVVSTIVIVIIVIVLSRAKKTQEKVSPESASRRTKADVKRAPGKKSKP